MSNFDLTKLPAELLPEPKDLPGELQVIAREFGVPVALGVAKLFGGTYLYIPKLDDMKRTLRDRAIRHDYDTGRKSCRELAAKNSLTERQIRTILNRPEPRGDGDDKQMGLWGR